MLRRTLIPSTVFLAIVALSGCTVQPIPQPSSSSSSATAAPTAAVSVYTCDDSAALDDVAHALAPADASVPTPVAATQPSTNFIDYAVPAVGGLSCSWRVGAARGNPMAFPSNSDLAHLSVQVVPGAADSWGVASALGIASFDYKIYDSTNMDPIYFDGYVSQQAGVFTCYAQTSGVEDASITVGYDLAGVVDTMISTPDSQAALPQSPSSARSTASTPCRCAPTLHRSEP